MNFLEAAMRYHKAGLKVIPFWTNSEGEKVFPKDYARFRTGQTEADVRNLFARDSDGLALICCDGIEAVDVDLKHDPKGTICADILQAIEDFNFKMPALVQRTKSGGYHFIYKCPKPEGNLKLARRLGQKEAMIETRGDGGILFVTPTPGYSITHEGLSLTDINEALATQEQRDNLIALCRHFDEKEPVKVERTEHTAASGETPLDAYNAAITVLDLLEAHGWRTIAKRGDYVRLNRPGAKHSRGVDGSVIVSANLFYPFTSSEAFEPNKAYSPAGVYAVLEHGGDFKAAAKALYKQGFGERIETKEKERPKAESQVSDDEIKRLVERAKSTRFNVYDNEPEPPATLIYHGEKPFPVAGRGMIGVFTGHEKSGKSFVVSCIAASALSGGEVLNLSLDLQGGKLLWFDTEQGRISFKRMQKRIYRISEADREFENYDAYNLRRFSPAERLAVVERLIYTTPGVSVVVIDGFVDLVRDYNDLQQVQAYVGELMRWSDERQVLILGVLHVNKGDGKIRGHIGSELKNKCDFIVNVSRQDGGDYMFSNPTNRNYQNFPDQTFSRDDYGAPVYASNAMPHASNQFPIKHTNALPDSASKRDEDLPF